MPNGLHAVPLPADEAQRLEVLRSYQLVDSRRSDRFDDLTRLAAEITGMPVALIGLLDETRNWFLSHHGTDIGSSPRELAFCSHAVLRPDEVLAVEDLRADSRFCDNPLVTLCVLDVEPRRLGDRQVSALRTLGRQVVAQFEVDRSRRQLRQAERALRQTVGRDRRSGDVRRLEQALDRDELVVHFQPFWDVTPRGGTLEAQVSGAEALVRWEHPQRGLLLPGSFVPVMEEQGLATRLGEVVLEQSLRQLAAWEEAGMLPEGFRLHVNVAAQQLHEGGVADTVDRLLAVTGALPGRLCLEVTESALLDATAFTTSAAEDLVGRGLSLALDDFGTGHSSLTQLRAYPFDCVKVDRSFVAGLGVSPEDEVIVDTVVSLAHRLGLTPVCEGVETPAQLDRVVEAGCTTVQGWLFGKASDAAHWEREVLRTPPQVLLRAARPPLRQPQGSPVAAAH